jgi:hypothetical protein
MIWVELIAPIVRCCCVGRIVRIFDHAALVVWCGRFAALLLWHFDTNLKILKNKISKTPIVALTWVLRPIDDAKVVELSTVPLGIKIK